MVGKESGGADGLIPGLPEELVLGHVLTRLPWYTRPVCRAISKSWRTCMDTSSRRPDLRLKSREHLLPLLDGCVLVCTFDTRMFISKDSVHHEKLRAPESYTLPWQDQTYQMHSDWQRLPPLQGFLPPPPAGPNFIASAGMVYVWSKVWSNVWSNKEPGKFVLKMDMGSGDWTWNKLPVLHPFNRNAVSFNGKIYVPGVFVRESATANPEQRKMVLVYDVITDKCEMAKAWNRDYIDVLRNKKGARTSSPCGCDEAMYSFVEQESAGKLEVLRYDTSKDTWRSELIVPIPESPWYELLDFRLVNADCFEPVPEAGINTIWVDHERDVISWFNAHLDEPWTEFDYHAILEGKAMEDMEFIGGAMYGMFIEEKDDEKDEGNERSKDQDEIGGRQDPGVWKRTIMKGTMSVAGNTVHWKEVLDVGCFRGASHLKPAVVQPISRFKFMA